jgi:16S rRNA (cytidine1402-2'-O)-methyltransferase
LQQTQRCTARRSAQWAQRGGLRGVALHVLAALGAAHELGIRVVPLVGPVSLLLALAASGLNGQNFAFVGYLPQDSEARAARIRFLEQRSHIQHETQLVIETPYRNQALFSAMLQHLSPSTQLSVACGLTLPSGWVQTQSIQQWKKTAVQFEKGLPCVFSFLALSSHLTT